jgi:hypothetical protein
MDHAPDQARGFCAPAPRRSHPPTTPTPINTDHAAQHAIAMQHLAHLRGRQVKILAPHIRLQGSRSHRHWPAQSPATKSSLLGHGITTTPVHAAIVRRATSRQDVCLVRRSDLAPITAARARALLPTSALRALRGARELPRDLRLGGRSAGPHVRRVGHSVRAALIDPHVTTPATSEQAPIAHSERRADQVAMGPVCVAHAAAWRRTR